MFPARAREMAPEAGVAPEAVCVSPYPSWANFRGKKKMFDFVIAHMYKHRFTNI